MRIRLRRKARDFSIARAASIQERADLRRLGSSYGGWTIPTSLLSSESICYSAGVGEDATFDIALVERLGCDVFAFDPTPKAIRHGEQIAATVERFHFIAVGLAGSDGERRFYAPAKSAHASYSIDNLQRTGDSLVAECLSPATLMRRLGHDRIDLLKADIEGAEYEVLAALDAARIHPTVICMEFHGPTRTTVRALRRLGRIGYSLAHREGPNLTLTLDRAGA